MYEAMTIYLEPNNEPANAVIVVPVELPGDRIAYVECSPVGNDFKAAELVEKAIAASPDLLDFAEGFVRFVGAIPPKLRTAGLKRQEKAARAAIAKATGG